MSDRTVETVFAEWRAAEAERLLRPGDIAHDASIAQLRNEYHAAVDARLNEPAVGGSLAVSE